MSDTKTRNLIELFPHPFQIHSLRMGVTEAVEKSFADQKVRNMTVAEVKRRFDICLTWAETLRGDLGWGLERIKAAFNDILSKELSGVRWEPSNRQVWIQTDGA